MKPEERRSNLLKLLDDLRDFRRQFEGRDVRLSDAVLEERREPFEPGPITRKATGLAKLPHGKSDRELLEEALAEKYGL